MFFDKIIQGPLQFYLYIALLCLFLIQMIYFWGMFSAFAFSRRKKQPETFLPVSVVICARNEYFNLEKNLPLILEQDYPTFEVIVVNDESDDDTMDLLNDLSRKYPNLVTLNTEKNQNFFGGKKFSLSLGIKSAHNEIILLTDADCRPESKTWIQEMQAPFSRPETTIVLGYGAYEPRKGLLNKLIRFDTLSIALNYFSMAKRGMPYMGVGRNLAYRRELFIKSRGFVSHYHVHSGDDDLFINQNASRKNTATVFSPQSHTVSEPKKDFSSWVFQKKRHLTTGKYYKWWHKIILALNPLTTLAFYTLPVLLLVLYPNLYTIIIVCAFLLLRLLSQLLIIKNAMNKLKEKNLLLFSPFFELFFIFFNALIMLSNTGKQENRWK
ncbi:MAG TPA: glycosyltransferase [Bacteroidales bacterium]|nr:glycosyltransferase [Bacteroidales bacterium]